MKCEMCQAHINDVIRKNFEVDRVKSSYAKGQCQIISDEDISLAKLHRVIDPTGYRITSYSSEDYKKKILGLF